MTNQRTIFNHVGLCVSDRDRSRRFYEGLLGFEFWWELDLPDEGTEKLLQLDRPIGVRATYLVRDAFVLELIDYSKRDVHADHTRVMDEVGLTHMSLSVSDLAGVLAKVAAVRRVGDLRTPPPSSFRDDPRSGRTAHRAAARHLAGQSASAALAALASTTYRSDSVRP